MTAEGLRNYFRQLFGGTDTTTPREGSRLTVETDEGTKAVRVQDVTNIGIREDSAGKRSERFSIILEGEGLEIILSDDSYEFADGSQRYPMDVRSIGPDDEGPKIYEALYEIEEDSDS